MLSVFSHFLIRGKQGGVEIFLDNLLSGLDEVRADYTEVKWRGPPVNRFVSEQLDLIRSPSPNVLLPNYYVPPLVPRRLNVTAVVHDLLFLEHPQSLPPRKVQWLHWAIPHALGRATRIIAISNFTKNAILEHYGRIISADRISVIHNPISLSRLEGGEIPGVLKGKNYVLCPSSGFWHKNVPFLLRMFARHPALEDLTLVIVGQRPSEMGWSANRSDFREEYLRLLESGTALELGYVSNAILGTLYRGSACVVFPSLYEGFGMPIFEALGLGARVVCNKVGAVEELCSGLASVAQDPADEDEWADLITNTRRPSSSAVAEVLEKLSPGVIAHEYLCATT